MVVVVSVSLIALLLTYLDSRGSLKNGMSLGFILVTILGCIHYNYGNDYIGYHEMYYEITSLPLRFDYLLGNIYNRDPGWVVLNHLFKHLGGFFMMVAVLNVIQNLVYFKFIKDNLQKKHWFFAMMIYLMSSSLYVMNFSMMRQGLAMALFIWSWTFLKTKRVIPALIILLIASAIHRSAQMLLPFVLLAIIPINNKITVATYISLIIALYFSASLLSDVFSSLNTLDELQGKQSLEYYSRTTESDDLSSIGLGFWVNMIPFVVAMWVLIRYGSNMDNAHKLLIAIFSVSFLVAPLGQALSILGRFGMYFEAFKIAAIPYIYSLLPKKWNQVVTALFVLMLVYGYISFFRSPIWIKDYSTFHTIFSVL